MKQEEQLKPKVLPRVCRATVAAVAAVVLLSGTACKGPGESKSADPQTQTTLDCGPGPASGLPFAQPATIRPDDADQRVLDTSLEVNFADHCVPVNPKDNDGNPIPDQWVWEVNSLRTYGSPNGSGGTARTFPGPTYRVRKAYLGDPTQAWNASTNPVTTKGDRVKILLKNRLPNNDYNYMDCDPASVVGPFQPPPPPPDAQTFPQIPPNCFHGADVTNLHFHGTHVSPQPHQDFVLLKLFSSNQTSPAPPAESTTVAHGDYQTDIDPLPWNQPPGTHWYHPHKHGSTALQVLNGMAGALLIEGPFDDWLYDSYNVTPENLDEFEKVLVLQEIAPESLYFKPFDARPVLVNGQAEPVIPIEPGKVYRWRFIGATTRADAQIQLLFPEGVEAVQIAQDGVQFSRENYEKQPFGTVQGGNLKAYLVGPGNRADFLVRAPLTTATGTLSQTYDVFGNLSERAQQRLDQIKSARRLNANNATGNPVLFRFEIGQAKVAPEDEEFFPCPYAPNCDDTIVWPETPYYLQDLPAPTEPTRTVAFSMTDPDTGVATRAGVQANGFWIDGKQHEDGCANYTMELDSIVDWIVTNDSSPMHPFHIHINPFQLSEEGTIFEGNYYSTTTYDPPIWQDTVPLPTLDVNKVAATTVFADQAAADAACPALCDGADYDWRGTWGTPNKPDTDPPEPEDYSECHCVRDTYIKIRHHFTDYTGAYVIHCHFLGHEDRGMMLNVQTVCSENDMFGTPIANMPDDCTQTSDPLPACQ